MQFPTLYCRTATGAVNEWTIQVQQNRFRTISGQTSGEKIISEWTVCQGKNQGRANATSGEEQAVKEAEAKFKKKLKEKYFQNLADIDQQNYVKPMLAKKFVERLDKIKYPVYVDIKYNGMRCIATRNGLFTRKGESIVSTPHVFEALTPIFKQHPLAVLDGELYNHEYRHQLNEIMKLVRKTVHVTPEDLQESAQKIKYYVYDGYGFNGTTEETLFLDRRVALKELLGNIGEVNLVNHETARNEQEVWNIYNKYVETGYEGAMVRLNAPYEHKRSSALLKAKPTEDDEFEILDVIEGEGNRTGMAGKVICRMKDGRTFGANMKGEESQFVEVLQNKQNYIGKIATIYYNGFSGLGVPNYAQFDCNQWDKGDR